ncbi:MAG: 16S rRNA (guanine(527)-N(7))-methyltransferase RsmG [Clostridia bacterium]|nr:16S rRNA (guanine(527)-N(7))-methyltransferase RsmG [Clostridia bacterium]
MTDFKVETLKPLCEESGFTLTDEAVERLNLYGNLLLEKNKVMNLTAITEPGEVLYKHFYDCLLFFGAVDVPENAKIIDVGTGAGFPGIVLKIARPDIEITLLDSLAKRVGFLSDVLNELSLKGDTVHLRAEEGGRLKELREKFDIACARAVAKLNLLCEYCVPYVKVGGVFVAMKGGEPQEEVKESLSAFNLLGCEAPEVKPAILPQGDKRSFIIAKKISQTSPKYPRNSAKISKAALI